MAEDAEVTTTPAGRSPAAERMRQHRERRRQGLRCLTIELHEAEVDVFVDHGLLKAEMRDNPEAVRVAVYDALAALYEHLSRTLD